MAINDFTSSTLTSFIASKHFEVTLVFLTLAMLLPIFLAFHLRYLQYLSLGPGGTPATFLGFLKIQALGMFAVTDPYHVNYALARSKSPTGYLRGLPKRKGAPPEVRGIAPQRQVTQKAGEMLLRKLGAQIERMALENDTILAGTSCFEKVSEYKP